MLDIQNFYVYPISLPNPSTHMGEERKDSCELSQHFISLPQKQVKEKTNYQTSVSYQISKTTSE